MDRNKIIVRTSIIGIITNVFLASFKAIVGLLSNSIAIVLDAVNNLSDALSSLITIAGAKLAAKPADKKHPFGYGRIEYMSALIISAIVLYAGITSFVESIKKIINPEIPNYTIITLIIVAVGVITKVILGRYVKSVGERVDSDSLIGSGKDATLDALLSFSTLVAAIIFMFTNLSLEAYLGVIISIVIIKSGIEMLKDTIGRMLGERADTDLSKAIKQTVCSIPGALGAFDLNLHDYGPEKIVGSVHVEVSDEMSAEEVDRLIRDVSKAVMKEHNVMLEAISIYAQNDKDEKANEIREDIKNIVLNKPHVIQIHGFYLFEEEKTIQFDLVVDFDSDNPHKDYEDAVRAVQDKYPEYKLITTLDRDTSD